MAAIRTDEPFQALLSSATAGWGQDPRVAPSWSPPSLPRWTARSAPETDDAVRSVTERLVLGASAPAQRDTGVLPDQVSARVLDPDLPSHEQGAVWTELDRRILGLRLLLAAVQ